LSESHSGYSDLLCTWHYATKASQLFMNIEYYFLEYNGKDYILKKSTSYSSLEEAKKDGVNIITLPTDYVVEYHNDIDEIHPDVLHWSPKDDDQYRK